MDVSLIKVNYNYKFYFNEPWTELDGDYHVAGYASLDTLSQLDPSYNMYNTLFAQFGKTLDDFAIYVNKSTIIYVLLPIHAKDPVEIEEDMKEAIYVPSSIVNTGRTFKYEDGERVEFNFVSGPRLFTSTVERNSYVNKTKIKVKETIEKMEEFKGDDLSISVDFHDVLTTKEILSVQEQKKEVYSKNKDLAVFQKKINDEAAERSLYERIKEAQESKSYYEQVAKELNEKIMQAQTIQIENSNESVKLNSIKSNMIAMLDQIVDLENLAGTSVFRVYGESGIDIFNALYSKVTQ